MLSPDHIAAILNIADRLLDMEGALGGGVGMVSRAAIDDQADVMLPGGSIRCVRRYCVETAGNALHAIDSSIEGKGSDFSFGGRVVNAMVTKVSPLLGREMGGIGTSIYDVTWVLKEAARS